MIRDYLASYDYNLPLDDAAVDPDLRLVRLLAPAVELHSDVAAAPIRRLQREALGNAARCQKEDRGGGQGRLPCRALVLRGAEHPVHAQHLPQRVGASHQRGRVRRLPKECRVAGGIYLYP